MRSCANFAAPRMSTKQPVHRARPRPFQGPFLPAKQPLSIPRSFLLQSTHRPSRKRGITMTNYWKICAAILAGTVGLSAQAAGPVTRLKVMSFNIQVNGSGSGGINQCVNAIQNSGADIVGIQEADGYSLKTIASQLNWYFVQTGGGGQYGVVSRYPIIKRIGETTLDYGGVGATIQL